MPNLIYLVYSSYLCHLPPSPTLPGCWLLHLVLYPGAWKWTNKSVYNSKKGEQTKSGSTFDAGQINGPDAKLKVFLPQKKLCLPVQKGNFYKKKSESQMDKPGGYGWVWWSNSIKRREGNLVGNRITKEHNKELFSLSEVWKRNNYEEWSGKWERKAKSKPRLMVFAL